METANPDSNDATAMQAALPLNQTDLPKAIR